MDQAMKKAVEANRIAIMTLIEASGPQELRDLLRECAIQGNAEKRESVIFAVRELVAQGALYEEILYLEQGEESIVYDLPCQPWPSAA